MIHYVKIAHTYKMLQMPRFTGRLHWIYTGILCQMKFPCSYSIISIISKSQDIIWISQSESRLNLDSSLHNTDWVLLLIFIASWINQVSLHWINNREKSTEYLWLFPCIYSAITSFCFFFIVFFFPAFVAWWACLKQQRLNE